jgi:hypothetical protein
MIDWLVARPLVWRHPALCGALFTVGLAVAYLIVLPPVFWVIGRLFAPVLEPIGHAAVWWWKLWS